MTSEYKTRQAESAPVSVAEESGQPVAVSLQDLPLACPRPGAPLWAKHPRVYLDVLRSGEVSCPYCGTIYQLRGEKPASGH